jgi:hypothetical protein
MAVNSTLRVEIQMYQNSIKELENLNQMIKDEHQALQLAFASLEEKLRKAQVNAAILLMKSCHSTVILRLVRFFKFDSEFYHMCF